MAQIQLNPPEKETGIPVRFRRNLFEEGPMVPGVPDAPDGATTGEAGQVNIFHCALHPQKLYGLLGKGRIGIGNESPGPPPCSHGS